MSGDVTWFPRIGSDFGGYRLDSLIGHGGMSIVYRAHHLQLGRTVALKLLSPELTRDASFRDRFTRESQVAAGLDHPNVIPIFEAGDQDGVLFIAMRYVEGADLKTRLKRDGPLAVADVPPLIAQVAAALDSAHARGLVHRDVKPANILIASGAGPEGADHVYLSDFGVAKTEAAGGLTKTGMFVGTAEYAAPEQFEGKPLDGRTDIYALGCVLYECLTGAPAYDQDSEVAMMYAHLLQPPPKATEKRAELPEAVDDVIATAMAKSRDDRYATGRELAAALRSALTAGAEPSGVAGATTPAATVLAADRTAPPPPPPARDLASESEPRPPRRTRIGPPAVIGAAIGAAAVLAAVVALAVLRDDDGGEEAGATPPASTAQTGGGQTGTTPAESQDTLLDVLVPTQIARTCTKVSSPIPGAVEAAECNAEVGAPTSAANEFTLTFFGGGADLERAYRRAKTGATLAPCGSTTGERAWIHQATGKRGGRRFCSVDGNEFTVVWTHEKLGSPDHVDMLGVAHEPGRAPDLVSGWWNAVNDNLGKCRPAVSEEECTAAIAARTGP